MYRFWLKMFFHEYMKRSHRKAEEKLSFIIIIKSTIWIWFYGQFNNSEHHFKHGDERLPYTKNVDHTKVIFINKFYFWFLFDNNFFWFHSISMRSKLVTNFPLRQAIQNGVIERKQIPKEIDCVFHTFIHLFALDLLAMLTPFEM